MIEKSFSEFLEELFSSRGVKLSWLVEKTRLPRSTIKNWLSGSVQKPRHWQDVILIAKALRLNKNETNQLLALAAHLPIDELLITSNREEQEILAFWIDEKLLKEQNAPFQAIPDISFFVGRKELIETLKISLTQKYHRTFYSLEGMGGVGKTTLAARVAYQFRSYFPDGILWVQMSASDKMSLLGNLASAFGEDDIWRNIDLISRSQKTREVLANKRALLILDDVRSRNDLELFLPPSGPCAALITTRNKDLSISFRAKSYSVSSFLQESGNSFQLFSHFLGKTLVQKNRNLISKLANALGHHPLAITLSAGRLVNESISSVEEFVNQILEEESNLQHLEFAERSVKSSFNVTTKSLPEAVKAVFFKLSVFGEVDFEEKAVAYVIDQAVTNTSHILQQLYKRSLLQRLSQERYRLHPLILSYVRERKEIADSQKRLIQYYVKFAEKNTDNVVELSEEGNNILYAINLSKSLQDWDSYLQGILALQRHLFTKGLYTSALEYYRHGIALDETHINPVTRIRLYANLGTAYYHRAYFEDALQIYKDGLALAREINDESRISLLLTNISACVARQGNLEQSAEYLFESLELAKKIDDQKLIMNALNNLAEKEKAIGQYENAEQYYLQALEAARKDNTQHFSTILLNLSALKLELDKPNDAEKYLFMARKIARKMDYKKDLSVVYTNLGEVYLKKGEMKKSRRYYERGVKIAIELNNPFLTAGIRIERGKLYLELGEWDNAHEDFAHALDIAVNIKEKESEGLAYFGLARACFQLKNLEKAKKFGLTSLRILETLHHPKANNVSDWMSNTFDMDEIK
ncbi:tetratricopeptide repeat protein [Candidatus Leptofilum sp.]|uniref:tetratricopeptide repeat protein n=1 Tax=Candidatus Leptofilum sp. TaxID=3241576 RepID=UPI003B5C4CD8